MASATFEGGQQDWVRRARGLVPLLKRNASLCEEARRLPDDTIAALDGAGLFGMVVPARLGGGGAAMESLVLVSMELAQACASTAWVQMILAVGGWNASTSSAPVQRLVFAGGVPRVCGVGSLTGTARPVAGGYRVSGRWSYATGALHAQWIFLSVALDAAADGTRQTGSVIVPVPDLTIEDTWHVAGMRGTGSNTVVAQDLFVPEDRFEASLEGGTPVPPAPGPAPAPSDFWPFWPAMVVSGLGPAVGIALGMFETVTTGALDRTIPFTNQGRHADNALTQRDVAEAGLQIDAARILTLELAREIDGIGARGERDVPAAARARVRGYAGFIAQLLLAATQTLVTLAGSAGFAEANPLQRAWRDLNFLLRHGMFVPNPGYEIYGKSLLGVAPTDSGFF